MEPIPHSHTFAALLMIVALFSVAFVSLPGIDSSPTASVISPTINASIAVETNHTQSRDEGIRALYLTSGSVTREEKISETISLINETELNAVIFDIKDYEGSIMYQANHPEAVRLETTYNVIKNVSEIVDRFHNEGIYVIARVPIFQDTELAEARPELAVSSKSRGGAIWRDHNWLAWVDPASKEVWDYNITLIEDVLTQGFDEVNLDYIRFPSDGALSDMAFPVWDEEIPRSTVLRAFFRYLRRKLPNAILSADLFGFTTSRTGDLGIGQIIEHAYESFDYVAPMIYPSHYPPGHLGLANPAEHPAAVIRKATRDALRKLYEYHEPLRGSQLRPWLQDFDLGAVYDGPMVRAQIDALYGAYDNTPYDPAINGVNGYMLWNASNNYTREALKSEFKEY